MLLVDGKGCAGVRGARGVFPSFFSVSGCLAVLWGTLFFDELAGATAHLDQHVEARMPAEDVVGVIFEDRLRLAGLSPLPGVEALAGGSGHHFPSRSCFCKNRVGRVGPVPEDVVPAPLLQLAVDVVVAAAAPPDHAGAARLNQWVRPYSSCRPSSP